MAGERGWGAAEAVIAALVFLGGLAVAFGVSTPSSRLEKVEASVVSIEARVNKGEQAQEDMRADISEVKTDVKEVLRRLRR